MLPCETRQATNTWVLNLDLHTPYGVNKTNGKMKKKKRKKGLNTYMDDIWPVLLSDYCIDSSISTFIYFLSFCTLSLDTLDPLWDIIHSPSKSVEKLGPSRISFQIDGPDCTHKHECPFSTQQRYESSLWLHKFNKINDLLRSSSFMVVARMEYEKSQR